MRGRVFATFTENSLSRVFVSGQDVQWVAIIRSFVRPAVLGTGAGRQSTLDFLAGLFFIMISSGTSSAEMFALPLTRIFLRDSPLHRVHFARVGLRISLGLCLLSRHRKAHGPIRLMLAMNAIIETPRLILRHFVEKDLAPLTVLMANADFMRFSSGIFTPKQTAAFLFERVIAPARAGFPSQFALIFREENRLIGYCGFFRQLVDGIDEIEIGYRLHPDFWNRGLATEAAHAVRNYAFEVIKLERVVSLIHPDNHASRRVTEKNGMTLEKETTFRGFPTLVFASHPRDGGCGSERNLKTICAPGFPHRAIRGQPKQIIYGAPSGLAWRRKNSSANAR